jgi:hypothetical protein
MLSIALAWLITPSSTRTWRRLSHSMSATWPWGFGVGMELMLGTKSDVF